MTRATPGAAADRRPPTLVQHRPRPLAELLAHAIRTDEPGLVLVARALAAEGFPTTRARLLELCRGALPTRVEMTGLAQLGVPLAVCVEWRLLCLRDELDPQRVGLAEAAATLAEIEATTAQGDVRGLFQS